MSWTDQNYKEPQSTFGQGAANNSIGWGQAATNAIGWGWGHIRSLGHAVTNLFGELTPPDLYGLVFTAAQTNYVEYDTPITLTNKNWEIEWIDVTPFSANRYIASGDSTSDGYIHLRATQTIRVLSGGTLYGLTHVMTPGSLYKLVAGATDFKLYEDGILVETFGDGGNGDLTVRYLGSRDIGTTPLWGTAEFTHLKINGVDYLPSTVGTGIVLSGSDGNNGTLKTIGGTVPTWNLIV